MIATRKNSDFTTAIITCDLKRVYEWAEEWKVQQNYIFKCKTSNNIPILINGDQVKRVEFHKQMVIWLSYNLDWSAHIHNICMRANRKLGDCRSAKM